MKVAASSILPGLRLASTLAAKSRDAVATDARPERSLAKQLSDWQAAQAKAVSAFNSNPQQAALEKAAMLKQRLEMLKAMLLFASPEMAKSIAQQLKSISGELASLGKRVGGSAVAVSAAPAPDAAAASSVIDVGSDAAPAAAAVDSPVAGASDEDGAVTQAAPDKSRTDAVGESATNGDDKSLRQALRDARQLLKALIERVKAKLREGDSEAQRDLQAAEKRLSELDGELAQGASLYTASGNLGVAAIDAAGPASTPAQASATIIGGSVDVSA